MEDLRRFKASRKGYRTHVTRTLSKITGLTESTEPITPDQIIQLKTWLNQLKQKKTMLEELDAKIVVAITQEDELSDEICEAEEYKIDLLERIALLEGFIASRELRNPPPSTAPAPKRSVSSSATGVSLETSRSEVSSSREPSEQPPEELPTGGETTVATTVSETTHTASRPNQQNVSRLPKLNLPYFSGDPLMWQTFWDSFSAAVHSNSSLTGIQKFNYLRTQLQGDAAKVVAGFPLTDINYEQSVTLLKERFGQPYKLVSAHMQALLNLASVSNTLPSLQSFYDTIESHVRGLASLGKHPESYGAMLTPIILGKLPKEIRKNIAREHNNVEWTLEDLRGTLLKEIQILETGIHTSGESQSMTMASFHTGARRNLQPPEPRKSTNCVYCKQHHSPSLCNVVTNTQDRMAIVKRDKLCFNCLGHHKVALCNSKFRCKTCKHKHHTSLCSTQTTPTSDTNSPGNSVPTTELFTPTVSESSPLQLKTSSCLLKTAIAMVSTSNVTMEGNIIFDEGAQRSFITEEMATKLNLKPSGKDNISLASFGSRSATNRILTTGVINVHALSGEKIPVSVLVVPKIAPPIQNYVRTSLDHFPHIMGIKLAHPVTDDENFEISILIGADYYWTFIEDHIIRGTGPTAVASKLGYLLSGPLPAHPHNSRISLFHVSVQSIKEASDIERFWNIESTGTQPTASNPDEQFLQSYISTNITCQQNGSYSLKFPWKENHPPLPNNYDVCNRRTRSLARRLAQTPDTFKMYSDIISDQLSRGFIERVQPIHPTNEVHYIPHHPVRKDSTTTPIRIVYDCSCRQSKTHPSLNDCLVVGPTFLNDMCSIILRFRLHRYGLSTDIEKAFLHVALDESDRDYTRFLWLSDPTDPESKFNIYRFKTVLFGSVSSPFMLYAALHFHLQRHSSAVANDIANNLYVDNVLTGCATEAEAIDYYTKARSILDKAKFNLRSWSSNSEQVRQSAQRDNVADKNDTIKVLGLLWHTRSDTISLASKITVEQYSITKRAILQSSSAIFDPLGLITPVTIQAKTLQELWKTNVNWDEPLDESLQNRWRKITLEIKEAVDFLIPRQYFPKATSQFNAQELHVFADASLKAYGAVAYFLQNDVTSLVMSKTRVSPLKPISLPRLELMAAVLATRLANFILSSIECQSTIYLWSDSQIVLCWINSSKKLKPFVSHRIEEITSSFSTQCWHYCPSADNPADLLTRGISSQQFMLSTVWKHGPPWLTSKNRWPTWSQQQAHHPESTEVMTTLTAEGAMTSTPTSSQHITSTADSRVHQIITSSNYSNLNKLLRVTAYILRFTHNCRNSTKRKGALSSIERKKANLLWILNTQQQVFSSEIANIRSKSQRLPLVRQLRLFLDQSGALRCGGRIHNAPIGELAKFPYLLPTKHHFTHLVIYAVHNAQLHAGVNSTLTAIRQSYWIPAARQMIRQILRKCVTCQKVIAKPYQAPDPPPLIMARTQASRPFQVTGVDFTGALYVRNSNGEMKVYICLFTCAVTRAIHLEVVTDMSVETFLLALRRFSSRRSTPNTMISDNASTYQAAADELKQLFSSPLLSDALSQRGIDWKFIPKRAPWFGGFWERLIGLTKLSLKKILGRTFTTLPVLQTLVIEVEAMLNDRPLTYLSSDITDPQPLTPSHLIYGQRIVMLPHLMCEDDEMTDVDYQTGLSDSLLRRKVKIQALLLKHFWTRWKREYLTSLREFHRTTGNNKQQISIGDVILIHDDIPRVRWKLAVVKKVNKGRDGLIRSAVIRTSNGITNRPITKLYPLEITANCDSDAVSEVQESRDDKDDVDGDTSDSEITHPLSRSMRVAATKARSRISEWTQMIGAPPEDVEDD